MAQRRRSPRRAESEAIVASEAERRLADGSAWRDFCRALDASKDRIPWAEDAPLPLAQMVRDTPEGHLEVPLHPAAEKFWRERGYL